MKKRVSLLVLVLMILMSLVGCSADKILKEANPEAAKVEVDMKDMDALYAYVKQEIVDITRENFNTWDVYYFDITKNGTDEVVFVATYGLDWYEKMEIISGDSGEYKRIPSDIDLAKYKNIPDFRDGFLTVKQTADVLGEHYNCMSMFFYDGKEMVDAWADIQNM